MSAGQAKTQEGMDGPASSHGSSGGAAVEEGVSGGSSGVDGAEGTVDSHTEPSGKKGVDKDEEQIRKDEAGQGGKDSEDGTDVSAAQGLGLSDVPVKPAGSIEVCNLHLQSHRHRIECPREPPR